jgi:AraC family transcriptional regulator
MLYTEHIQKALEYMETHLTQECSLECCAHSAGYSAYHFSRIFKDMTGLSPMDYMRKRRLTEAAREVACTPMPLIDIAVKWGFESAETFLRAFEAEHGITPGRFRGTGMSLHLTEPFRLAPGEQVALAEPSIMQLPQQRLCGYPLAIEPGSKHGIIPRFWNQYHERNLAQTLPGASPDGWFDDVGCSVYGPDGAHTYVVGIWTDRPGPAGTMSITLPEGCYAVFTTPQADGYTFVETVHRTWNAIYEQWLPRSAYRRAPGPQYETYCEKSHSYTEKIGIPIQKRE